MSLRTFRKVSDDMVQEDRCIMEILEIWNRYPSLRAQLLKFARELEAQKGKALPKVPDTEDVIIL